jgi:hypothetical protein
MRTILLAVLALTLATGVAPSAQENKAQPKETPKAKAVPEKVPTHGSKLMQEKLKNAQKLLEALAMNEFEKITGCADELMRISKQVEWTAIKTPQYELHTNSFRRAIETIQEKAKAKNVDGATLGYVDMTLTCVRCHQYTREVRETSLPRDPSIGLTLGR